MDFARVKITAFRAIDNPRLCELFIDGHERVLTSIGVVKVTSSDYSWTQNPAAFVTVCTDMEETKALGGARFHVCGGTQELPLVDGVIDLQPDIRERVKEFKAGGTGELCGLWNSLEVAGMGIGAIYVVRTMISVIDQIGIPTSFALCSPGGAKIAAQFGYEVRRDIGNEGTFYYPKQDLIATMVFLRDTLHLTATPEEERQKISELRANRNLHSVELNRRKKQIEIFYSTEIPVVDTSVFDYGT